MKTDPFTGYIGAGELQLRKTIVLLICLQLLWLGRAGGADPGTGEQPGLEIMRVGYSGKLYSGVHKADAQVAVELWAREVTLEMGREVSPKILFYDDLPSLFDAATAGDIDVLTIPVLDFLELGDDLVVQPSLVSIDGPNFHDQFLLLARREAGVGDLRQFKDRILMVEGGRVEHVIANLWLETMLMQQGLWADGRYFATVRKMPKASQAVLAVFFGKADAALVRRAPYETMVELNPQLREELEIIASSPAFLRAVTCFPAACDPEKRQIIERGALRLHTYPKGMQILTLFGVERVVRFQPAYLEEVITMVREHRELRRSMAALQP